MVKSGNARMMGGGYWKNHSQTWAGMMFHAPNTTTCGLTVVPTAMDVLAYGNIICPFRSIH